MVPKIIGEQGGAGAGNDAVAAGVFRKGRGLEDGPPLLVDVAIDGGFGPDTVGVVLFFPAADKGIMEPGGHQRMDFHSLGKADGGFFAGDPGDVDPVAAGADFL